MPQPRVLLALGRVSNLPTVWSNCLAGWWLSGHENFAKLPFLFLGTTFLYIGGMFLNDAFDVEFDRQRRPNRPIPSGKIPARLVWQFGWGWLAAGILSLICLGKFAGTLGIVLAGCILLYNALHKVITASPWLMGACRFWVYVIAGTTGSIGLNGWPIWCGIALAFYIVGLSYIAQRENFRGPVPYWPFALLALPVVLAMMMNVHEARMAAVWLSVVLMLWIVFSARNIFGGAAGVKRIVANLLAGIVLVDWLAVGPACPEALHLAFILLFGLTLVLQRFVPAT